MAEIGCGFCIYFFPFLTLRGYLIILIHDVVRASPAFSHPNIAMPLSLLVPSQQQKQQQEQQQQQQQQ